MTRRAHALALALAAAGLAGCPGLDPMQRQQKVKAYQASDYHADGLAMRAPPPGTVPAGPLADPALATGLAADGRPVDRSPVPATPALLAAGRKKFDVHCAVCHGLLGDGQSQLALNMALRKPPSLHLYRDVPDGHLYRVATEGFGLMGGYRAELTDAERWAVVAYVRALQLSQHASLGELTPEERRTLGAGAKEGGR